MANQNTVTVQLTVKDDGSVVMQQFGKNSEDALNKVTTASPKATSALDSLKSSYLDCAAKAATAYMAIQKAMEYMDLGAKAAQAEASFRTLAQTSGESADAILSAMKKATDGTVDDSEIMQKSTKAMMLGFSGDQIEQMGEMARLAARTSGEDVGMVFDNIVNAISTNMPRTLKQYGLITKEQMSTVNQAMAEGVTDINLYSMAVDNFAVQSAKIGPLLENEAEKLQQHRAQIMATKEALGDLLTTAAGWVVKGISAITEPFAAIEATLANAFSGTFNLAPIEAYIDKLMGVDDEEKKIAATNLASAQAKKAQDDADMKTELGKVAQKKANLETMKALDKDYFTSQEANIKAMEALKKAAGEDDYKIASDSLKKQKELNTEYYTRTKQEIDLEAAARSKADRDKISDAAYTAQKMQELDTQTTNKAIALMQQERQQSISTAQNDIKNLTSRLTDYQKYYDSLKAKMDQNIADEKKHLEELKTLRQQSVDLDKSTAALIAGIKGTDTSQSAQQQYDSSRSALNSQYSSALNLSGQDEIKALEDYKQAVAALQKQYAQGIPGVKDIFGNVDEIVSAKTIATDAISDIERATENQRNALIQLTAEKQNQITADQLWGQTLQEEALKAQNAMDALKNTISDLSTQIQNMQKTIELTGIDKVSSVVDSIISRIQQLHTLAAQPITISTDSNNNSSSSSSSSNPDTSANLNLDAALKLNALGNVYDQGYLMPFVNGGIVDHPTIFPMASGMGLMGEAGPEAILPLTRNSKGQLGVSTSSESSGSQSISFGNIIIQVPASAALQSKEDWRSITRNYIVPELKKLSS
jgi:hypothetical protein